jgi:predicted flap endonuclease-1-like 5' DNA nuclease
VTAIKGIGQRTAALLHTKAKISSAQDLLSAGATPQGRQKLQSQTKLSPKLILRWVQLADLMRIEGVGPDASQLLWDAGVTSIPHLAAQNPKTLLKRLRQPAGDPGGLPALVQVTDWVQQASKMQAMVRL